MLLNYVNDNHINYVKSLYKMLNGKTVLYERIIDHSKYSFFNNYLIKMKNSFIILIKTLEILNFL